MYSFKYSERPNTLALKRMPDDVPRRRRRERIVALQSLQKRHPGESSAEASDADVRRAGGLASRRRDWELSGRTSGNTVVNFAGNRDWIGASCRCESRPQTLTAFEGRRSRLTPRNGSYVLGLNGSAAPRAQLRTGHRHHAD
jgi:tRNA A37 methylthiotransferase MiaB